MMTNKLGSKIPFTILLKWILIGSLLLNVFLIGGMIVGAYHLFWSDNAVLNTKNSQNALRFAADGLSVERQHDFKKLLRETRQDAKPLSEAAKAARIEVRKLIAAPTFDREAVKAAITHAREADIALRMRIEEALINYTETLTQNERIKLANGLAKNGPLRQPPLPTNNTSAAK